MNLNMTFSQLRTKLGGYRTPRGGLLRLHLRDRVHWPFKREEVVGLESQLLGYLTILGQVQVPFYYKPVLRQPPKKYINRTPYRGTAADVRQATQSIDDIISHRSYHLSSATGHPHPRQVHRTCPSRKTPSPQKTLSHRPATIIRCPLPISQTRTGRHPHDT